MRRVHIAVTMGDPCGIGPEVLAKALPSLSRIKDAAFFIFGDALVLAHHGFKARPNVVLMDLGVSGARDFSPGAAGSKGGRASLEYLMKATAFVKNGDAHALVTGPISKKSVIEAGFSFSGHTEFLAHAFGVRRVEMVFISPCLKVVLLTRHIALARLKSQLTGENIVGCGSISLELLKKSFCIRNPKIAVSGFNPHAGESGLFGDEEDRVIRPAIKKLNRKFGLYFFGPFSPDTVFARAARGEFDMVMAMYHDQGLIPFKLLGTGSSAHLTAGLPVIRTSPVHGTAFDIVGKNMADPASMSAALELAYRLTKNRLR